MKEITIIRGDGIGQEIMTAAIDVINATGVQINWEYQDAGLTAIEKYKDPIPPQTLESIRRNKILFKGPLTTPIGSGFRSVNVALRKEFDLYVNFRPVRSFEGIQSIWHDVDLIIFRENTEEFYSGIEHYVDAAKSAAEAIGIVTRFGSERILRYAFEYAKNFNRKRVTIVHKANILKYTSGLFLEVGQTIAKEYPGLEINDRIIDNMSMQLVMNPHQFDVVVTTNMFGDILSDLCSGLVGGLGLAPGANIGNGIAMFEAVHGSAPDIAGKNLANPAAVILAGAMMLRHIGEDNAADRIETAVKKTIKAQKAVTKDLNPSRFVGTIEMGKEIIANL
jgi:isocitrate dehydrogenase (NAD+)